MIWTKQEHGKNFIKKIEEQNMNNMEGILTKNRRTKHEYGRNLTKKKKKKWNMEKNILTIKRRRKPEDVAIEKTEKSSNWEKTSM